MQNRLEQRCLNKWFGAGALHRSNGLPFRECPLFGQGISHRGQVFLHRAALLVHSLSQRPFYGEQTCLSSPHLSANRDTCVFTDLEPPRQLAPALKQTWLLICYLPQESPRLENKITCARIFCSSITSHQLQLYSPLLHCGKCFVLSFVFV